MERTKSAVINVTFNISGAIDTVKEATVWVEDCGLNASEQEKVRECLSEGVRLLEEAYDIVDHVKV